MALTSSTPSRRSEFVRPHGSLQCAVVLEVVAQPRAELEKEAAGDALAAVRWERLAVVLAVAVPLPCPAPGANAG